MRKEDKVSRGKGMDIYRPDSVHNDDHGNDNISKTACQSCLATP